MRRTRGPGTGRARDFDAALACLSADQLRLLVRDMLLELDEPAHGRVVGSLIARAAAHGPSGNFVARVLGRELGMDR
jgi:hypothetical protein